jgi:ABC-type polysaccharide/polyol phosphate transport system ATPase subunit
MKKAIIEIESVSKEFFLPHEINTSMIEYLSNPMRIFKPKGEKYQVLKDIDLQIYPGEFIGIIGTNGSGKSTLLKILAGVYQPTNGKIKISGTLVPFLELGVGFNPELTGRENIFLNGIILGMSRKFLEEHFEEIVMFAELEKFLDLPLKNYSSGMQVRLAFSIAMKADSDVYLLDEVLAVGDQHFQEKCIKVFTDYKMRGKTIVFVTHSASAVKSLCSRAVLIRDGMIAADGLPKDVLAAYES